MLYKAVGFVARAIYAAFTSVRHTRFPCCNCQCITYNLTIRLAVAWYSLLSNRLLLCCCLLQVDAETGPAHNNSYSATAVSVKNLGIFANTTGELLLSEICLLSRLLFICVAGAHVSVFAASVQLCTSTSGCPAGMPLIMHRHAQILPLCVAAVPGQHNILAPPHALFLRSISRAMQKQEVSRFSLYTTPHALKAHLCSSAGAVIPDTSCTYCALLRLLQAQALDLRTLLL